VHDPPDLGADFPGAFRSLRPGRARERAAGFPLVGLSKERPSIVPAEESASRRPPRVSAEPVRASPRARSSFGMRTPVPIRVPPSWFLTTSTVSSSPTPRPFSGRGRSWGSPRLLLSRNRISRDAPAALRSLPSADSDGGSGRIRSTAGPRHRADRLRPSPSPRTLPPRPFLPRLRGLGPRGLAPSSGPLRRGTLPSLDARCSHGLVRLCPLLRGKPAKEQHVGITSKTTPKSGSSV
jgi:hypothetical protein